MEFRVALQVLSCFEASRAHLASSPSSCGRLLDAAWCVSTDTSSTFRASETTYFAQAIAALRLSDESQRTFVPDSSAKGPTTFAGSMRIHQSLSHRSHDTDGEGSSHCQRQQRTTEAANMNRHARIQSSRTAGLASVVPFARRAPPIEATVPIGSYNAMGLPSQVWDA